MTFEQVVEKVRNEFGNSDVSNYEDHLALQVNIVGEGSGAFYVEINEGKLNIEGYDYNNNNAEINGSSDDIISVFSGKLEIAKAVDEGKLTVTGDYAKALSIQPVIDGNKKPAKKTPVKKAAEKKAPVKKAAEKKATTKKTASKTTKTADKKASAKEA